MPFKVVFSKVLCLECQRVTLPSSSRVEFTTFNTLHTIAGRICTTLNTLLEFWAEFTLLSVPLPELGQASGYLSGPPEIANAQLGRSKFVLHLELCLNYTCPTKHSSFRNAATRRNFYITCLHKTSAARSTWSSSALLGVGGKLRSYFWFLTYQRCSSLKKYLCEQEETLTSCSLERLFVRKFLRTSTPNCLGKLPHLLMLAATFRTGFDDETVPSSGTIKLATTQAVHRRNGTGMASAPDGARR